MQTNPDRNADRFAQKHASIGEISSSLFSWGILLRLNHFPLYFWYQKTKQYLQCYHLWFCVAESRPHVTHRFLSQNFVQWHCWRWTHHPENLWSFRSMGIIHNYRSIHWVPFFLLEDKMRPNVCLVFRRDHNWLCNMQGMSIVSFSVAYCLETLLWILVYNLPWANPVLRCPSFCLIFFNEVV